MNPSYPPYRALVPVPKKPENPIERAIVQYNGAITVSIHAIEQMWSRLPGLSAQVPLSALHANTHIVGQWLALRVLHGSVTKIAKQSPTRYDVLGPQSEAVYRLVESDDSLALITVLSRPINETRGDDPEIFKDLAASLRVREQ